MCIRVVSISFEGDAAPFTVYRPSNAHTLTSEFQPDLRRRSFLSPLSPPLSISHTSIVWLRSCDVLNCGQLKAVSREFYCSLHSSNEFFITFAFIIPFNVCNVRVARAMTIFDAFRHIHLTYTVDFADTNLHVCFISECFCYIGSYLLLAVGFDCYC